MSVWVGRSQRTWAAVQLARRAGAGQAGRRASRPSRPSAAQLSAPTRARGAGRGDLHGALQGDSWAAEQQQQRAPALPPAPSQQAGRQPAPRSICIHVAYASSPTWQPAHHRVHKARHEDRLAQLVAARDDALLQHRHGLQETRRGGGGKRPPQAQAQLGGFGVGAEQEERGTPQAAQRWRREQHRQHRTAGSSWLEQGSSACAPRLGLGGAAARLQGIRLKASMFLSAVTASPLQPLASGWKSSPRLPREMMTASATRAMPSKLRTAALRSTCMGKAHSLLG